MQCCATVPLFSDFPVNNALIFYLSFVHTNVCICVDLHHCGCDPHNCWVATRTRVGDPVLCSKGSENDSFGSKSMYLFKADHDPPSSAIHHTPF